MKTSSSSRRDFLKTGAAAATGVLTGCAPGLSETVIRPAVPPTDRVIGANDRITVGFIGLGWQGFDGHLATIREHGSELNAVGAAVCEPWTVRLDRARTALELTDADAVTDYRHLLDRQDIDAVFIGTPEFWHSQIAIDAMDAGKHLYCEKPLTRYLGEAFQLHDTLLASDRVFQLGSQYCSEGKWHRAAEIVSSGKIGAPVLAQASYMRNVPDGEWNYEIDPALTEDTLDWNLWVGPVPNRRFSPNDYFRWKKYYPYTAGIIANLLTHRILPLMMATGAPEFPVRVACLGSNYITPDRDIPDNTQIIAEFPNGLAIAVVGSTVNEVGLPDIIRGHEGTLYFGGNSVELRPERPFADLVDPEMHEDIEPVVSVRNHVANWFDGIRTGVTPTGNIDLAIKAHTVVCLAEMSQRLGEMMHFDPATRTITTGSGRVVEPFNHGTFQ
jgi:predicted dehydrogenase